MYQTEYVRSLHSNYERLCLSGKPKENRYQFCMLSRGGIKGLLNCDLRYINGSAYLYYDITSKQNLQLLYQRELITREWLLDFVWSMKRLRQELNRFLLQENCILWEPVQVFQDLEKNEFSFLYVPYYEGDNDFLKLLSFFVEHIDYSDEKLVECVYHAYEQTEKNGNVYLQEKFFEDMSRLEGVDQNKTDELPMERKEAKTSIEPEKDGAGQPEIPVGTPISEIIPENSLPEETEKKKFFFRFDGKKAKGRQTVVSEQQNTTFLGIEKGQAVAEETAYQEDGYGQTVFLDARKPEEKPLHRIYSKDGKIMTSIENDVYLIGKNKGKVDVYLEDLTVSRMHCRIIRGENTNFLEDLNSTNGSFINNERLQPYERKELEPGDEITCGKVVLLYR